MKRSERLMRNTILALFGVSVLYVAVNRLYAGNAPVRAAQRTPEAEMAALRDFDAIDARGDFAVEVVQGAEYSVALTTSDASRGEFAASLRGKTLVLRGFRNAAPNRVRVSLPALTQLYVDLVPALSVSGFSGESLSLKLEKTPQVTLRNNSVRRWTVVGYERGDLKVDRASLDAGEFDLSGRVTLSVTE